MADAIFGCLAEAARQGRTYVVRAGFFEIYRGKCADLLNKKKKIEVRDDKHGTPTRTPTRTRTRKIGRASCRERV